MIRRALAALGLALGLAGGSALAQPASEGAETATAIFAGGCFWCMEPPFDKIEGVVSTTSGYTGGSKPDPTYQEVSAGKTGHTEALKVVYDPAKVSYERLLEVFWRNHDPLSADGQFCDKGSQYRAGIFFGNEEEKKLAEASKAVVAARFKQPIVTEIVPAATFYPAEDYHQDYYIKNPIRYKYYSTSCGRYRRLKELWGDEAGGQS
jgi:peptide-methionine (S)-S-oxide reductase